MAFKATNLTKYLARYAEPEATLATPSRRYTFAIVVPVCGESYDMVDGWRDMTDHLPVGERVLFVVVVNSDAATPDEYRRANDDLLERWSRGAECVKGSACPTWLVESRSYDVLLVDRHSPTWQLPPKSGVGLARKVGGDLVCAWFAAGGLESPWWLSTDADVHLPAQLHATWSSLPSRPGIGILPFEHVAGDAREVDLATLGVELDLRYHVLGLGYAGSSYAWPALGSCIVVHIDTYVALRGFPKRQAGEDFYLLEKASKLAPIMILPGEPVRIVARRSSRTPFGTGRAVEELLRSGDVEAELRLRHPACYEWLKALLLNIRLCLEGGSIAHFQSWLRQTALTAPFVVRAVTDSKLEAELLRLCVTLQEPHLRCARANEWFGGLRQIQFLKALERTLGFLPYRQAFTDAPFVGEAAPANDIPSAIAHLREIS